MVYCSLLDHLGVLKISGPQAGELLQGQLSCNVLEVTAEQSRLGVHCNAKGRVLASGRLAYIYPDYYFLLPLSMVGYLLKDLSLYARFYKVQLQNVSSVIKKIGLIGVGLESSLPGGLLIPLEKGGVHTVNYTTVVDMPGVVPRVVLLSVGEECLSVAAPETPWNTWEQIDIESGLISILPETRALFTPHHLNYPKQGAISFIKGCYTGQEVIARMHYLGQWKQTLYQVAWASQGTFVPGMELTDDQKKVQGILMMVVSDADKLGDPVYRGLAVIQKTAVAGGALYLGDSQLLSIKKSDG